MEHATTSRPKNESFFRRVKLNQKASSGQPRQSKSAVSAEESRIKQLEHELAWLEQLAAPAATAITADAFGLRSLREGQPQTFDEWVVQYEQLIDLALENRIYRVEHNVAGALRSMAERLGQFNAGPRDVIDLHTAALRRKSANLTIQKAQASAEEGHLLALELMGDLVSFYRTHAIGARFLMARGTPLWQEKG